MSDSTVNGTPRYYVPHSSIWPIVGSIALFVTAYGGVHFIHQSTEKVAAAGSFGQPLFFVGLALIAFMMFGWFGTVIRESLTGMVSPQLDRSFRMGDGVVHHFRGHVLRRFFWRVVLCPHHIRPLAFRCRQ